MNVGKHGHGQGSQDKGIDKVQEKGNKERRIEANRKHGCGSVRMQSIRGCILREVVVDPLGYDIELQLMRELHADSKVQVDSSTILLLMEVNGR